VYASLLIYTVLRLTDQGQVIRPRIALSLYGVLPGWSRRAESIASPTKKRGQ